MINLAKMINAQEIPIILDSLQSHKRELREGMADIKIAVNDTLRKSVKTSSAQESAMAITNVRVKHPFTGDTVVLLECLIAYKVAMADLYKKELRLNLLLKKIETISSL